MGAFEHAGVKYVYGDFAIGPDGPGICTAAGAIRRLEATCVPNERCGLRVLDMCCGVGVVGFTILNHFGHTVVDRLVLADINVFNIEACRDNIRLNHFDPLRVEAFVSNGTLGLPDERFDLIVSNPPHQPEVEMRALYEFATPSVIGGHDPQWKFHRQFYSTCHRWLNRHGAIWFIELGPPGERHDSDLRSIIEENSRIEYLGSEVEPTDPLYRWMLSRMRA